jgi:hypothetical protein
VIQPPSRVGRSREPLAALAVVLALAVGVPAVAILARPPEPAAPAVPSAAPTSDPSPPTAADNASPGPSAGFRLRGPTNASRIVIPLAPGAVAVAVGAGHAWAASAGDASLRRIDPDGTVDRAPISLANTAGPTAGTPVAGAVIGLADGSVWIAGIPGERDLVAVDGRTASIVRRVHLPSPAVGLVGGFGSAWIATADGRVLRVTTAGRLDEVLPAGRNPAALATGGRYVWVSRDGTTTALRPNGRTARAFHAGGGSVGVQDGTVWVLGRSGPGRDLSAIDEATLRVTYRSDVGTSGFSGIAWALPSITPTDYSDTDTLVAPRALDAALVADVAWVGRPLEGELWRIGPPAGG